MPFNVTQRFRLMGRVGNASRCPGHNCIQSARGKYALRQGRQIACRDKVHHHQTCHYTPQRLGKENWTMLQRHEPGPGHILTGHMGAAGRARAGSLPMNQQRSYTESISADGREAAHTASPQRHPSLCRRRLSAVRNHADKIFLHKRWEDQKLHFLDMRRFTIHVHKAHVAYHIPAFFAMYWH